MQQPKRPLQLREKNDCLQFDLCTALNGMDRSHVRATYTEGKPVYQTGSAGFIQAMEAYPALVKLFLEPFTTRQGHNF